MDHKPSSRQSNDLREFKQHCLELVTNWATRDISDSQEKTVAPVDVGVLVQLLQALGFRLESVEKTTDVPETSQRNNTENGKSTCSVVVNCNASGLQAVLQLPESDCHCPSTESTKEAQFWEVSGSAPVPSGSKESLVQVRKVGSSLLPELAPSLATGMTEVLNILVTLMSDLEISTIKESSSQSKMLHVEREIVFPTSKMTKHVSDSTLDQYAKKPDSPAKYLRSASTMDLGSRVRYTYDYKSIENREQSDSFATQSSSEEEAFPAITKSLEIAMRNIQTALRFLNREGRSAAKDRKPNLGKEKQTGVEALSSPLMKTPISPKFQMGRPEGQLQTESRIPKSKPEKKQNIGAQFSPPPTGTMLKRIRMTAAASSSTPSHVVSRKRIVHTATPRPPIQGSSTARNIYQAVKQAAKERLSPDTNNSK